MTRSSDTHPADTPLTATATKPRPATTRSRFQGCLLGGAIGDALGAPIEFLSLSQIQHQFGNAGLVNYAPAYGRIGAVTDDTQLTLFTAEGLIRAQQRLQDRGICNPVVVVWHAYLRWLSTQLEGDREVPWDPEFSPKVDGWLIDQQFLHSRRAPGNSCISALESGSYGTLEAPINNSKGCGGVMRAAPVGLVVQDPFTFGCEIAAITHGHPSGYFAAGALALIINQLVDGSALADAVSNTTQRLRISPDSYEVVTALNSAVTLAHTGKPSPDKVTQLGAGWVAEEALAIAVYCALVAKDFRSGVLLAVNHSGDSDSTGSICGNLLGTLWGTTAIPLELRNKVEGNDVIIQVADDLLTMFIGNHPLPYDRYPTW